MDTSQDGGYCQQKMDSKSEQGPNKWFVTAIQFSYFIVCQGEKKMTQSAYQMNKDQECTIRNIPMTRE
jgi:hypothetical protein